MKGYQRVTLLLVAIGLFLRVYHFLSDPSLWFDEAAVVVNLLEKSYAGLLGSLRYAANGPPLFLWLAKALGDSLGEHPWVWRLPALCSSCLGLVLFYFLSRRVMPAEGWPWAVGLFALSDRLLWHSVEVRPYTIDVLVVLLVVVIWEVTQAWRLASRLLLVTLLFPALLALSYPAVFVCIGPTLLIFWDLRNDRSRVAWLAGASYLVIMAATLTGLLLGPIAAQLEIMRMAGFTWQSQMPDWSHLDRAFFWPLVALFEVHRYCFEPTGGPLCLLTPLGAFWMISRGQGRLLILLLTPLLMAMIAACAQRYPCGHGRPMLFMTPALALLTGTAIPLLRRWSTGWQGMTSAGPGLIRLLVPKALCPARIGLLVLVLMPMGLSLYRAVVPWPRFDCRAAAEHICLNRKADDVVVISSWDQDYFFRHLEPHWRCGIEGLRQARYTRAWATFNQSFAEANPKSTFQAGSETWRVLHRRELGPLLVVLLERVTPASPEPR